MFEEEKSQTTHIAASGREPGGDNLQGKKGASVLCTHTFREIQYFNC